MQALNITVQDRACVNEALLKAKKTGTPSMALTLDNGKTITSKTSPLLSAPARPFTNIG